MIPSSLIFSRNTQVYLSARSFLDRKYYTRV